MGNFYPMMATSLFAVFWLSFGMLQLPSLGLAAYYSSDGTNATEGATTAGYNVVIGLYLIVWGFAFLTYLVFALKTNMVFAGIFFFAVAAVWCLAGAYIHTGLGDYAMATALQKVSLGNRSINFPCLMMWVTDFLTGRRCSPLRRFRSWLVDRRGYDGC